MRRVLQLVAAAACGAALAATPQAGSAAGRVHTITIRDMAFGPAPGGLRVGDTVEWVNADIFRHSATAADRSFDLDLPPRARGQVVLKRAGAVTYGCRFHPGMTGRLVVGR